MLTSATKDLSNDDLRQLVEQLIGEVAKLREQVRDLEEENAALKDEVARLKGHKGRPALKPSGMEKGTAKPNGQRGKKKGSRPSRQKLVVNEEQTLEITPPQGSRFKGYEDFVAQELGLEARIIRYRRQRWQTADGQTLIAPLPQGLRGHFGPELVRFILLQHHQGQVTIERITGLLNDFGLVISKRQVQRLLTGDVTAFAEEAQGVLQAGLETAPWITVDDTGARHRAKNGVTTQIGDDRFTFFATTFSKSRKNFLELLRAGHADYVINAEALDYMHGRNLSGAVIKQLGDHDDKIFADHAAWSGHLEQLGIDKLKVHPLNATVVPRSAVKIATEGAIWGSVRIHGFLHDTVILSDDAGQFRIGEHALCWVHAERLVHKLIGFNDQQRQALDVTRQLIWWFYRDLKIYKDDPCRKRAAQMRARFDRIFTRNTGFAPLDRLLTRLQGRKDELLLVLDRPDIPLHTNGSENDIRCHVTKRKVSGGTWSDDGRQARDTFLGLLKTCQKLRVSFFDYLGHRL
ncbi:MAG: transposase, partial [Alphaproteobacteria bacterium]|nr:transposase [Alphaproteobacteria bacterium]